MDSNIKNMNMAMVAVLLVVVCAALMGCEEPRSAAHHRSVRTESPIVANSGDIAAAIEESEVVEVIPSEHIAPSSAEEVVSSLADARTTLGETMKALAEILDASQRMQRDLLEAPKRFSSPERSDDGGEEER